MEYKKREENVQVCLECGDEIRYGRKDKRFCSPRCKNRYHNALTIQSRNHHNRVLAMLHRNYDILERLLVAGRDGADIMELVNLGFTPNMLTSCSRSGKHTVHACFDIRYIMTGSRIYSIAKIQNNSLNLPPGKESAQ